MSSVAKKGRQKGVRVMHACLSRHCADPMNLPGMKRRRNAKRARSSSSDDGSESQEEEEDENAEVFADSDADA